MKKLVFVTIMLSLSSCSWIMTIKESLGHHQSVEEKLEVYCDEKDN